MAAGETVIMIGGKRIPLTGALVGIAVLIVLVVVLTTTASSQAPPGPAGLAPAAASGGCSTDEMRDHLATFTTHASGNSAVALASGENMLTFPIALSFNAAEQFAAGRKRPGGRRGFTLHPLGLTFIAAYRSRRVF